MNNLRGAICRSQPLIAAYSSSSFSCRCIIISRSTIRVSHPNYSNKSHRVSIFSDVSKVEPLLRFNNNNQRRTLIQAANWTDGASPYQILELEGDADEENIKLAYRRLAKFYHPDVYDGRGTLEEGETAETRFIKIQAAYELLMDKEQRRQYDKDNRVNPMKASQAWMEWLIKKRKAFDQRGDMAIVAWAEQQQREMNLRVRRLSRSKEGKGNVEFSDLLALYFAPSVNLMLQMDVIPCWPLWM
ncbi:uncharacterized protein LOC141720920 isoform X2 [Apium graveolens]|uniref:uncharacterized protein LOC141720920 isoform X2 n=1 Tax=Apium graveolens TaxID=4045 RepID=UPI003D7BE3B4